MGAGVRAIPRGGSPGKAIASVVVLMLGMLPPGCGTSPPVAPPPPGDLAALPVEQAVAVLYTAEQRRVLGDDHLGAAKHGDAMVRATFARAAGRLARHPAALLTLAQDPERSVRLAALEAITVANAVDPEFLSFQSRELLPGVIAELIWPDWAAPKDPAADPDYAAAAVLALASTGSWHSPLGANREALTDTAGRASIPIRAAAYRGLLLAGGDRLRNLPGRADPLDNEQAYRAWLVEQAHREQGGPLAWWPVYLLTYGGTGGPEPGITSLSVDDQREALCAFSRAMEGDGPADRFRRMFALRALATVRPGGDDRAALLAALDDPDPALVVEAVRSLVASWPDAGPNSGPRHQDLETVAALANLAMGGAMGPAPRLDPRSHGQREAARALGRCHRYRVLASHVLERLLVWALQEGGGHVPAWLPARARLGGDLPPLVARWARVHADPLVRAALARSAQHLGPQQGLEILSQLALDTDVRVRTASLEALAGFPDSIRSQWLLGILARERDIALRETLPTTAQAMGAALPDPAPILEILAEAFGDSDGREFAEARRLTAATAASLSVGADLPDWVLDATTTDPHLPVRREAARWVLQRDGAVDPARLTQATANLDPGWITPRLAWTPEPDAEDMLGTDKVWPALMDPAPKARIHTAAGIIEITLRPDLAPTHCWSFLQLAQHGAYNGLPFHRVVPNFVVQGGDHRGDGFGAAAWHGGFLQDELSSATYAPGAVGMPKTPTPDTGGGQFFISTVPTPHLDTRYTVFGFVTAGLDVAESIAEGAEIDAVNVIFGTP